MKQRYCRMEDLNRSLLTLNEDFDKGKGRKLIFENANV